MYFMLKSISMFFAISLCTLGTEKEHFLYLLLSGIFCIMYQLLAALERMVENEEIGKLKNES